MIKLAKSEEDYVQCAEFLKKHDAFVLPSTVQFYIEGKSGDILSVAGYNREFGGCIEPLYSENKISALRMFYFMQGLIKGLGYKYIRARTIDESVANQLLTDGFTIYNHNHNEFIKEI